MFISACCLKRLVMLYLIILNIMHIFVIWYICNSGRNVMKLGRIMKRRNLINASPSRFLPLLWLPPYLRDNEKIMFHCPETPPSIFCQSSPNLEEYITAIQPVLIIFFIFFSSLCFRLYIRIHGIKTRHLIGLCKHGTTNMATLAVYTITSQQAVAVHETIRISLDKSLKHSTFAWKFSVIC